MLITAITSFVTVTVNNNKAKERDLDLLIIKEKQKTFEHYYNFFFEILTNVQEKRGEKPAQSKLIQRELMEFKRGLMNWGSEDLIQSYMEYESAQQEKNKNLQVLLRDGDKFMMALRKEMGFNDTGKVSILSILLNADARKELAES